MEIENIDEEKVFFDIRNNGYSILPGFLSPEDLDGARSEYFRSLENEQSHPPLEKFKPIELAEKPWRKFAIGSKSGSGEPYSQLLKTTYFSDKCLTYPVLSKVFGRMIKLRNRLTNMHADYGSNFNEDDFWNACRVHHYPCGGGHMASHKDTLFPRLLSDFEFPFIQIMVTLTNRKYDFNLGGGYIIDKQGEVVFFENESNAGSLILFNGETVHGVEDIDPDLLLDMNSKSGRIALFVNLYANIK